MSEDTLTLADGTVINLKTGRPVKNKVPPGYVAVPTSREAQREVVRVRKRLADLPDVPEKMNIVAVVASYYMFGLDNFEIAHALQCTERQIANIKMTEAFTSMIEAMAANIVETEQDDVRTLLATHARDAVTTIADAMQSENEQVAVVAAKDILDRTGNRPADIVEHRHRIEGGLTIEYVRKGGADETPYIDLNAEDYEDAGR